MNEYEFIGRLADLDSRLRKIEGREPIPEQPAPAPVSLVEAVESVLSYLQVGEDRGNPPLSDRIRTMRLSLAAEVKRQEAIRNLVDSVRVWYKDSGRYDIIRARLSALDALDKA